MANTRRKPLRGAALRVLDLVSAASTPEEWAAWLKVPLEIAVRTGDRDLASMLVRGGAEAGTAVNEAIACGDTEVMNLLLDNGASVSATDAEGSTPLHIAARTGKAKIVRSLLLKGAEPDAQDCHDYTPLYIAAMLGHTAAARALLAAGADMNLREWCDGAHRSPLELAASGGHVGVLRAMIHHGVDVNAGDNLFVPALHLAVAFNKVKAVKVLLEAGANIQGHSFSRSTPLHLASFKQPSVESAVILLDHGADVNAQNDDDKTPLHFAASYAGRQGSAELVDLLLRRGADETIVDRNGQQPADRVGHCMELGDVVLGHEVVLVHELLANAPADKAWRRRGLLVLCRAWLRGSRLRQEDGGDTRGGLSRRTRSRAKLARSDAVGAGRRSGTPEGGTGDEWRSASKRVVELEEEGIFRSVVGFL
ncbi:unnamed protein product [Ectocarpus sp. 13 AM-2016]